MRYRALIEYDGTAYYGFQRQIESQPTIQGKLEMALRRLAQQPVTVTGAGRTDSGVHARGQVISFDLEWRHGVEALKRALNVNLPEDIAALVVEETTPAFHPRYDARRRIYQYTINNAAVRHPLRRLYAWPVMQLLDEARMNEAAQSIVGVHDFATFGQAPAGENTVREVFRAEWQRDGDLLFFTIEANAFLYRMVRSLAGSLKAVGAGEWRYQDFVDALWACDRNRAEATAPPQGLCLVAVQY